MSLSNNPPDVSLELDADTARFLLDNCETNLTLGLGLIMSPGISRENAEKLVAMNDKFKIIRDKLKKQGITTNE